MRTVNATTFARAFVYAMALDGYMGVRGGVQKIT